MQQTNIVRTRRRGMIQISIHVPISQIRMIDELVREGLFPSRSDFIRYAIRQTLDQEYKILLKMVRNWVRRE